MADSTITITLANDTQAAIIRRAMDLYASGDSFYNDGWPDVEGQRASKAIDQAIEAAGGRDKAAHVVMHTGKTENGMHQWQCACGLTFWQSRDVKPTCPVKAQSNERLVATELAQLMPSELDAFCKGFPVPLPDDGERTAEVLDAMAKTVLQHESVGDAIARLSGYVKEAA